MNKFQKVAVQMVKDDMKKSNHRINFRKERNEYYLIIKKHKYPIIGAIGFKNFNKTLEF